MKHEIRKVPALFLRSKGMPERSGEAWVIVRDGKLFRYAYEWGPPEEVRENLDETRAKHERRGQVEFFDALNYREAPGEGKPIILRRPPKRAIAWQIVDE